MKIFNFLFLLSLLFCFNNIQAQNKETKDQETQDSLIADTPPKPEQSNQGPDWQEIKKKLVFGGNLGLSFFPSGNSMYTIFQISPQVGYKVKENLIAGAGMQFFSISSNHNSIIEYGPDVFLRAHLINIFFAQAQFEYLNFDDYLLPGKRVWNPAMLLGFGYGTYGYSFGIYTNLIQNRFSDMLYPGNFLIGKVPFFFKGQILF